jgi:hypothetical protein
METKEEIVHPQSGNKIVGRILEIGEVLKGTDVYSSDGSGNWEKCPCPGAKIPSGIQSVIWVRPEKI